MYKLNIENFTPRLHKQYLFFIAALLWTFAGIMLLVRGLSLFTHSTNYFGLRIVVCLLAGSAFYLFMFAKLSVKHTQRIMDLKMDKPCLFSFFGIRSYLVMFVMITMGITVRKSGIVAPANLAMVYLTMGVPLFLSAFRFYYFGLNFKRLIAQK